MNREELEDIFEAEVVAPLEKLGFVARGRSLYLGSGIRQVGLIRLSGRLQRQGAVNHVIVFRHAFLRELKRLTVPARQPTLREDYPWIADAEGLPTARPADWVFAPARLMHPPSEPYEFESRRAEDVREHLALLTKRITDAYLPWTETVTPERAREEMRRHAEEFWAARQWLEDYDRYLESEQ